MKNLNSLIMFALNYLNPLKYLRHLFKNSNYLLKLLKLLMNALRNSMKLIIVRAKKNSMIRKVC